MQQLHYNSIKSIFDGSKINEKSTINEESSINEELNKLIKNHIFLKHNKPSSKKTNHNIPSSKKTNKSEELRKLFSNIGLDYNQVTINNGTVKYESLDFGSVLKKKYLKIHPNTCGSTEIFQQKYPIIERIKEIYGI